MRLPDQVQLTPSLADRVFSVPHSYLATLGVIALSFFPLTYPWVMCTPWCFARLYLGRNIVSGVTLLASSVWALSGTSQAAHR